MDIGVVPEGAADSLGLQHQPATVEIIDKLGLAGFFHRIGDQPQTMGKDGNATGLVDEVERAAIEGELLVSRLRAAGQENHRQGDAVATQAGQQIDTRYAGQAPIQHDDFGLGSLCKRAEECRTVAEGRHLEPVIAELVAHRLTVIVCDRDVRRRRAEEVRPLRRARRWCGTVDGRGGRGCRHVCVDRQGRSPGVHRPTGGWIITVVFLIVGLWSGAPSAVVLGLFLLFSFLNAMNGTLTSIYPGEVFPTEIRGVGTGFAAAVSRVGAGLGTFLLPITIEKFGVSATILVVAVVVFSGALVSQLWAPETKGMSLSETAADTRTNRRRLCSRSQAEPGGMAAGQRRHCGHLTWMSVTNPQGCPSSGSG